MWTCICHTLFKFFSFATGYIRFQHTQHVGVLKTIPQTHPAEVADAPVRAAQDLIAYVSAPGKINYIKNIYHKVASRPVSEPHTESVLIAIGVSRRKCLLRNGALYK